MLTALLAVTNSIITKQGFKKVLFGLKDMYARELIEKEIFQESDFLINLSKQSISYTNTILTLNMNMWADGGPCTQVCKQ